jgi:acetyl esterase/lipase
MWTIPVTISASNLEKQLIEAEVRKSIAKLGQGVDRVDITAADISGEWQGVKHVPDEKSQKWSTEEQYDELFQGTKDGPVILYLHGGAYIVASPDTHRVSTLRMAEGCGGRIFSLRYRLAPQDPFPAALIDSVLAYNYLIDPPEGALHLPVDPAKIVIAGDSAGVYLFGMMLTRGWISICSHGILDSCSSSISTTGRCNRDLTMVGSHSFISVCQGG